MAEENDKILAILAHALGIVFGWLPPLIIWLVKKDESAFVDHHGRQALGFQLTLLVGYIVSWILALVVIGFLFLIALYVIAIVFGILASIAASKGEDYEYPKWTMIPWPFLKA